MLRICYKSSFNRKIGFQNERKSLSWVSERHRYKISEGSPTKGEKKHYSMDISSFFFVYVDFLLYLCISYN